MTARALPEGEAHVFWVATGKTDDEDLLARYRTLLAKDETERYARLHFERTRREFLVTRALVRTTLSRYAEVAPDAWRFEKNEHGCPFVGAPKELSFLRFNLTNTAGVVAIVVARDVDVGIDVEDVNRRGETTRIADRFFSASEVAELETVPEERQRRRFFDYWTLKEAYIKARGMGLAIPLGQFSFTIPASGAISIAFDARLADDAATWQFAQFRPTDTHLVSVAVRRGRGPDLRILTEEVVPRV